MDKLEILYDNTYYLAEFIKECSISGDIQKANRTAEFTLMNTVNGTTRLVNFQLGKMVIITYKKVELFRGYIFTYNQNSNGEVTITAHDPLVYLTKNQVSKKYAKTKASTIIKGLCNSFGIPVGNITDTGHYIKKMIMRDRTLWDIMITALTMTKNETNRKYWIYCKKGRLYVAKRTDEVSKWIIEDKDNLYSANFSHSMEELRNKVVLLGGDIAKKYKVQAVEDKTKIKAYGLMQYTETVNNDMTTSQMKQKAKELLKEKSKLDEDATVETEGIYDCIAGRSVYIKNAMTGLLGGYYIQTDKHTWSGNTYRMTLTVKKTDELPTMLYQESD